MSFVAFSEFLLRVQSDDEGDGSSENVVMVVLAELKGGNNAKLYRHSCCIERIGVKKSAH
jgi:hypothetical protein